MNCIVTFYGTSNPPSVYRGTPYQYDLTAPAVPQIFMCGESINIKPQVCGIEDAQKHMAMADDVTASIRLQKFADL
jgi:hypothetical protein